MPEAAKRIATYEDLYAIPESMIGEIIHGELTLTPRPSPRHAHVISALGGEIVPAFHSGRGGGPGGWIILGEVEVKLGEQIVVPDLAGWRKERFPKRLEYNWLETVPDWVCEILSPATALRDRTVKKAIYEEHRVGHLWLVDPFHQTLEVFRLESDRWILASIFGGGGKARLEPFEEMEINLGGLWLEG